MAKIYNYDVMFDDTSIDVSKEVGLVWSIANSLRGAYTSDKYKDVIIPMVILRRFECALEAKRIRLLPLTRRTAHSLRLCYARFRAIPFIAQAGSISKIF